MFSERDKAIVEKIISCLENDEEHVYFVIVGAFHLVGDDGLLKLLESKGYKTKQL